IIGSKFPSEISEAERFLPKIAENRRKFSSRIIGLKFPAGISGAGRISCRSLPSGISGAGRRLLPKTAENRRKFSSRIIGSKFPSEISEAGGFSAENCRKFSSRIIGSKFPSGISGAGRISCRSFPAEISGVGRRLLPKFLPKRKALRTGLPFVDEKKRVENEDENDPLSGAPLSGHGQPEPMLSGPDGYTDQRGRAKAAGSSQRAAAQYDF
ncbi:MAG: hypothetical protein PUK85_03970, partial [Clostridia bacterium]|nr:hypothetical protein [Clostridia bacterium]